MRIKEILFSNIYRTSSAFGMDISDFSIKIAQVERKSKYFELKNYNRMPIPAGVIEGGLIKNKKKLIEIIKKSIKTGKGELIKTPYAVCSLPEQHAFIKMIKLPKMTLEEAKRAIKWEAEASIPFSLDEVYFGWQIIPQKRETDHLDVLINAVPKNLVNEYLGALRGA